MDGSNEGIEPKKSPIWLIFLIIVLVLIVVGGVIWWWWATQVQMSPNSIPTTTSDQSATTTPTSDNWVRDTTFIRKNTTSTCTIMLENGNFRMFLMEGGKIVFADSVDGRNFTDTQATDIAEDPGLMISNPAVLKIADGNWIMIYEQAPTKQPGAKEEPPSTANQRNLYLATSTDGTKFTKVGVAIDSAKEDSYFASVPDLILLSDGKIRMYYVCGGSAICSAISSDGKSWNKETGIRIGNNAVDPDALISTKDGKTEYVLYYSLLSQTTNRIYKAISADGLTWSEGVVALSPSSSTLTVIDPDVVKTGDATDKYLMYFGEAPSSGTAGGSINLYLAENTGNIF